MHGATVKEVLRTRPENFYRKSHTICSYIRGSH